MGHHRDRGRSASHPPGEVLRVSPPLSAAEVALVGGLAGVGPVLRVWPGQPRSRSPWLACAAGCCLVGDPGRTRDAVVWLRLLLREVLCPRSQAALTRVAGLGLPGGHRVDGRVSVGGRGLVVRDGRVRESSPDDDADQPPAADSGRQSRADDPGSPGDGDH